MKKFLLLLIIAAFCACGKNEPPVAKEPLPKGTLAVVAGAPITQADFDEAANGLDAQFADFLKTPAGKEIFLSFLINEKLLQKAAEVNDIENSAQYKEAMEQFYKEQETAAKQKRDYLIRALLNEKLDKEGIITVSEDEIRAYHRKYPYQLTIAHILLSDAQKAAAVMREVAHVRTREMFGDYVRKFSVDPMTSKAGGLLEPFIPGEYLPEIEIPAANTPAFQTQGFIKTPYGFHIIMKVKEESISFNNAKERIKDILVKQKTDAYLETIRQRFGAEVINNESK